MVQKSRLKEQQQQIHTDSSEHAQRVIEVKTGTVDHGIKPSRAVVSEQSL